MARIRIKLDLELPYTITEENGRFVSACEPLQVYSHGATRKEALANLREAAQVFVETCLEEGMGHLERVLRDAGLQVSTVRRTAKSLKTFHLVQPYMIQGSGGPAARASR